MTGPLKQGVSATLIVRDEARFLPECLASLRGAVDEIVVIDTGSQDATVAIAQGFGCKIGHFAWRDDFSAARNHAISEAGHEWILYIDADERLILPGITEFRESLADRGKAAWNLRLHPRVGWTAYAELRLFRNDPRIRFAGEIHERVHAGVNLVCEQDGKTIGLSDAGLQHVGYEDDQSPKLARNIPLLQAYLARDPNRVYCWWHLGAQFELAGDSAEARAAWENGVLAIRRQARCETTGSDSMVYAALIASRHLAGLPVETLLAEALNLFPTHYGLQWIAGKLALEAGALVPAREIFTRLACIDTETFFDAHIAYDHALFTHTAQESLALTAFRAGDYATAAVHYVQAAQTSPNPAPLRAKAALSEAKGR